MVAGCYFRYSRLLVTITGLCAAVGCARPDITEQKGREAMAAALNHSIVDTAVSLLHSGYIVLRMGRGADSYLLSQFNRKSKAYSHCGIVMVENGYPFVYHSIGGEDNPDERLRRDSASFLFSPAHNSAIAIVQYDFDATALERLKDVTLGFYGLRPKFDMKFDLASDDQLYCAEFVCKAINRAMNDPNYIHTTSFMGLNFVGVDDLFMNEHCHFIWQTRYK